MQLDTPTLAAVSAVGGAMFAVSMLGVWLSGTRDRCVASWGLAGVASAAGYLVGVTAADPRLAPMNWVAIAVANGLIGLSHALIFFGVRQYLSQRAYIAPVLTILSMLFAAALVSEELRTSLRARVLFQSAAYIVLDVMAAVSLLRVRAEGLRGTQSVTAGVLLVYAAFLAVRWVWLLVHPAVGDALGHEPLQAAVFPVTLVFNLALSTAIVLLLYGRKEQELRILAGVDPLTGLGNRAALDTHASIEVSRSQRYGDPLSVVMVDLDHFKDVNDSHGHMAGDVVLGATALALGGGLRSADRAFRIGGEEYLLLLPNTHVDVALAIAERLRAQLEQLPIPIAASVLRVTASFGVAELGVEETWPSLLERTDRALYAAKAAGRNSVQRALG